MAYLLIGLGNPGKKFELTRHNAGKMLAGWLRAKGQGAFELVETECFMNESGGWVKRKMATMAKNGYNGDNRSDHFDHYNHLFICHDDLDIPLGKFKIQFGKGPRLHNGVLSVEQALRTKEFWRVRIGVDGRGPRVKGQGPRVEGEEYVLEKFKPEERRILEAVFPEIKSHLVKLINVDVIV